MKPFLRITALLLFISCGANAQILNWNDVSADYTLPEGVTLHFGSRQSPAPVRAWYLAVDLNEPGVTVRPYLSESANGKEATASFSQRTGAYAAVNGGYFDVNNGASYSAVIYPGIVKARNLATVSRSAGAYYVIRTLFSLLSDGAPSVDYIYQFGPGVEDIYRFGAPLQNTETTPAPAPQRADGEYFEQLFTGIGGAPMLVYQGEIQVTYEEEVMFGSGVGLWNLDPRTAVGYTPDNKVIMMVVDGRQDASRGFSLYDLAQAMLELGCYGAMNLDGGGSSTMAVGGELINRPEGGAYQRQVSSILAVVHSDSLPFPKQVHYEDVIDTDDPRCELNGDGWFATANDGYYGGSPALLLQAGGDAGEAVFTFSVPAAAEYELSAWWVAASNRAVDTPFIVSHANGTDTVTVNQTHNGSAWNSIGMWEFDPASGGSITITNDASGQGYVVADAVQIVSYDSAAAVTSVDAPAAVPATMRLQQNYPNPFNPATTIIFTLADAGEIALEVFDMLGRRVDVAAEGWYAAGSHAVRFDGSGLASGVYLYSLQAGGNVYRKKMMLLK